MSRGARPSPPRPEPTADGSLTLRDPRTGETFHSHRGALAEARHVFLEASGVAARLAAGEPARVLEVGLGTGLNLLLNADAAVAGGAELDHRALEIALPPEPLLRELGYGRHLARPELGEAWLAARAALADPPPPRWRATLAPGVRLDVAFGDATAGDPFGDGWADAVYHDAFSPGSEPGLWSEAFLARLAAALAPGGALVSYSVRGEVRRRLAALGLRVEKLPGPPGGKREMLRAVRPRLSPRGPGCGPTGSPRG